MYEPVSDRCMTEVIKPTSLASRNGLLDGEFTIRNCYSDRTNDLIPPDKPPRKKKQNQINKQGTYEASYNKMKNGNGDTSCVDIDHITLENNYKNRQVDASVQTSPLIPYRLRFWPRSTCDVKCDPKTKSCTIVKLQCGCRIVTQWALSQVGLTLIVFIWALLGAYAFHQTEGPREFIQSEHLAALQNELVVDLSTELRQKETHLKSWTYTINKYMEKHENLLLEAVSAGFGEGGGGRIWTYPGCILFAVALLTTLGFGAPVPRTPLGRCTAVLFSAVGIPLHFLLVLNMGNLGAVKLQQFAYGSSSTDIPAEPKPRWLKWFPLVSVLFYYILGVILFGFVRQRGTVECFMFPLDFTAAGGVASVEGYVRILYALYLEVGVTFATMVVSLLQASATSGIVDIGLKLGLLTNT